jgi:hypothetical protein
MNKVFIVTLVLLGLLPVSICWAGEAEDDAAAIPGQIGIENLGTANHPSYWIPFPAHQSYAGSIRDFADRYGSEASVTVKSTWTDGAGKKRKITIVLAAPGQDASATGKGKGTTVIAVAGKGNKGSTQPDGHGGRGGNGGNSKVWVSSGGCGIAIGGWSWCSQLYRNRRRWRTRWGWW